MSPEQAECASVDARTDIWALGVVAFECLIGHPPFLASTLEGILAAVHSAPLPIPSARGPVPAAFDAWFQRACARDPEHRFARARTAAHELQRLFAAEDARRADRSSHVRRSITASLYARFFARSRRAAW
jgi:serine/threonine-protein kinase